LPARRKLAKVEHHAALPYTEIAAFMAALRNDSSIGARALEFTILTAARRGEVLGATWDEIDVASKVWTVSAPRTKADREHRVPLAAAAMANVSQMHEIRTNNFVFPGRRGRLTPKTMQLILRRMGRDDLTVHGFRSTFRDWAAERTSFPRELAEMALAHRVGNEVELAYQRGDLIDKRRRLMDAWADYCAKPAAGAAVTPIRGVR
jgi:integrase